MAFAEGLACTQNNITICSGSFFALNLTRSGRRLIVESPGLSGYLHKTMCGGRIERPFICCCQSVSFNDGLHLSLVCLCRGLSFKSSNFLRDELMT